MSNFREEMAAIKAGKTIHGISCPVCGNLLKRIIFGFLTAEEGEFIKKNHEYFKAGGCMIFGDDRDPFYICDKCGSKFNDDLKQIK